MQIILAAPACPYSYLEVSEKEDRQEEAVATCRRNYSREPNPVSNFGHLSPNDRSGLGRSITFFRVFFVKAVFCIEAYVKV